MKLALAVAAIAAFVITMFSGSSALCGFLFKIMGACGAVFVIYAGFKLVMFICEEKLKTDDIIVIGSLFVIAILCVVAAVVLV